LIEYYIKTTNPKSHIEACSIINYFFCEILSDRICQRDEPFYGVFFVKSNEETFEILSDFSSDIVLEIPPGKILR
jgi:hypothetical protein